MIKMVRMNKRWLLHHRKYIISSYRYSPYNDCFDITWKRIRLYFDSMSDASISIGKNKYYISNLITKKVKNIYKIKHENVFIEVLDD